MALVVVYHVWIGRVSGGVDVFFVLSGYLITASVLARHRRQGRVSLLRYWAHLAERLLPAMSVVLLAIVVAALVWLPPSRWAQTTEQLWASLLFFENWALAWDSVDYFADRSAASPLQHFWSLSVQGQFYLLWPTVLLVCVGMAQRVGRSTRLAAAAAAAVIGAASFVYSVQATAQNQTVAYFDTRTRLWEFAVGALAFLVADRVASRHQRWDRVWLVAGWAAALALVGTGLLVDAGSQFPGYVAGLPTAAAAILLLAGTRPAGPAAVSTTLSRPALVWMGRLSYPLYLWHWPVLIYFVQTTGQDTAGLAGGAMVIGVSLLLAAGTQGLLDRLPAAVQAARSRLATTTVTASARATVLATVVPVLVVGLAWSGHIQQQAHAATAQVGDPDHPGALALDPFYTASPDPDSEPIPSLQTVSTDWPDYDHDCDEPVAEGFPSICHVVRSSTPDRTARSHVVVVGDSHAASWVPALAPIATAHHWDLTGIFLGNCPLATRSPDPQHTACQAWLDHAVDQIADLDPTVVMTVGTRDVRTSADERVPDEYLAQWQHLSERGIPVLALRDNPRFDQGMPECIWRRGPDDPACNPPRRDLYTLDLPATSSNLPDTVDLLDTAPYFCPDTTCPPIIGNTLVYMDDNHISATYARTLAPLLEQALRDTAPQLLT